MKLKLNELKPNPFKKEINEGKLNREQIDSLKSNMNELGLMGSLPIFKKEGNYYLVAGHHRKQALKEVYGNDFEVECTLHNYDTENILRGMVIENLTQRKGDFREEAENLKVIRKFLKATRSTVEHVVRNQGGGSQQESGSVRDIYKWLNKKGEVLSIGIISEHLKIMDTLDKDLIQQVDKTKSGTKIEDKNSLTFSQAVMLTSFEDKEEQKDLANALKDTDAQGRDKQRELLSIYKQAPEEVKKEIRKGEIDIADIEGEVIEHQIKQSNEGEHTEFIPNFEVRLNTFSSEVSKLEQQVALFRKVFYSKSFSNRYSQLGTKEKGFLNSTVYSIRKRIKKCYDDVEFFVSRIEEKKLLEVIKK